MTQNYFNSFKMSSLVFFPISLICDLF
jgi:hypothetical protein